MCVYTVRSKILRPYNAHIKSSLIIMFSLTYKNTVLNLLTKIILVFSIYKDVLDVCLFGSTKVQFRV